LNPYYKMDSKSVKELKVLAKDHSVKGYYRLRKAELIEALAAQGNPLTPTPSNILDEPEPEVNVPNKTTHKCRHDKIKYYCKDCKGSQICSHNRRKATCKECKGSQICKHKIVRYICKDCNGKGMCLHGRQKFFCKLCKGSQICEHNRQKYVCKDCNGKGICLHGRQKSHCKDCHTTA